MASELTIGVIITLYNKEEYILRALSSVLCQTQLPEKIIIINDCSSDTSLEKVSTFLAKNNVSIPVTIIDLEKNVGAAEARNIAIQKLDTDYIMFLDADDQYEKDYINNLSKILSHEDYVGMIMSTVKMESSSLIYPSNKINKYLKNSDNNYSIIFKPFEILSIESLFIGGGNVCFNKSLITEFFDPNEKNFEEWNFYYSLLKESLKRDYKLILNHIPSYIYNDIDEFSLSRKKIESHKKIVVPQLINRLNNKEEKKYKSLLISMWLNNAIDRLKNYKEKFLFIYNNKDIIKQTCINRYTIGAIVRLLVPSSLYSYLKNNYKRKRFIA